ncbi:MAG: hypothetical protein II884_02665 [Synergistaceae bacterium]|nr:hypothetical protein [Synergistaceae bacterium]
MTKLFNKVLSALFVIMLFASVSSAAPSRDELKRMGIFISNFTEQGFYNFDIDEEGDEDMLHLGDPSNMSELIRFGIAHNVINRSKSTVRKCTRRGCDYGSSTMTGKSVAESVRKYFDMGIKNQSVMGDAPEAFYDGESYHFEPKQWRPETVYYAEVQDVSRRRGIITMTGELYNLHRKSDRPATFTAEAKPYKWDKKDTWSIISLRVEWR